MFGGCAKKYLSYSSRSAEESFNVCRRMLERKLLNYIGQRVAIFGFGVLDRDTDWVESVAPRCLSNG